MSQPAFSEPLRVDDYIMHTLERIREGRIEIGHYIEELSNIKSDVPDHGVPEIYQGADYIEEQTTMSEVYDMIGEVFFLELELIRHLQRLLSMREAMPLRQLEWHLELSSEDLTEIMSKADDLKYFQALTVNELDFDEVIVYIEDNVKTLSFGYPPALLLEAVYWPQRAAHHSK